ncbi:MAG: RNA methyltransferase [Clostridia bacterium]|nr:RNA methyltransferase [Clostridia bacterium]
MLNPDFLSMIRAQLGEETEAFLGAEDSPAAHALHINTLRPGAERYAAPYTEDEVPWSRDCRYVLPGERPGRDPAHDLGAYYLQEASAMAPAMALDVKRGERVLDLCASPGGKSFQIACCLRGEGLLISNEPVPARSRILAENLERLGVVNAVVTNAYPQALAEKWPDLFDAVLVDAPCSGEGMFRRSPETAGAWKPSLPEGCAKRQLGILDQAALMVKPGGRVVYSTCTFNTTENEGVMETFLSSHPDFSPEDFSLPGVGRSEGGMLRLWPHRVRGDGHFVAKLRRSGNAGGKRPDAGKAGPSRSRRRADAGLPGLGDRELLKMLEEEICRVPEVLADGELLRQADYLHLLPKGTPSLSGIRTVKPGLCLLRVGRSHIQPMPALARSSCTKESVPWLCRPAHTLELSREEYLRMRASGFEKPRLPDSRWVLFSFDGLPAAFIKGGPAGTL